MPPIDLGFQREVIRIRGDLFPHRKEEIALLSMEKKLFFMKTEIF
uniref:Uncharacterized protein n=1 Tax=Anguilla anguilla TaxID=7936 RepID=A0A0E9WD31_ANGAN